MTSTTTSFGRLGKPGFASGPAGALRTSRVMASSQYARVLFSTVYPPVGKRQSLPDGWVDCPGYQQAQPMVFSPPPEAPFRRCRFGGVCDGRGWQSEVRVIGLLSDLCFAICDFCSQQFGSSSHLTLP